MLREIKFNTSIFSKEVIVSYNGECIVLLLDGILYSKSVVGELIFKILTLNDYLFAYRSALAW